MTLLGPYVALGCPFEVEASPSIASLLAEALHDLSSDDTPRHRLRTTQDRSGKWTVGWDGEEPFTGDDLDHALDNSLSAVNSLAAREGAKDCAVLHAGLAAVDGRGVVFVGHSGAGKSTLTAAMAMAGHAYVADEVAAITSDTRIRAFHRPIGLRAGGAAALGVDVPPGPFELTFPLRLGHRAPLIDGAPLTQIFIVERVPDDNSSGETGLTRLEPASSLVRLVNHALARGAERATFRRIDVLVRTVPTFLLRYDKVDDAVGVIEAATRE